MAAAPEKLAAWVAKNGYTIIGLIRGQSIASAESVMSPKVFWTELQGAVKKACAGMKNLKKQEEDAAIAAPSSCFFIKEALFL